MCASHDLLMLENMNLSTGYVSGVSEIRKILETRPHRSFIAQAMLLPSALEMLLYFHALAFLKSVFK